MLIDSDQHPENNLYYIGAKIIELFSGNLKKLDIDQIHNEYNRKNMKISFDYLLLGLDWLYLLGVTEVDDKGHIILCS